MPCTPNFLQAPRRLTQPKTFPPGVAARFRAFLLRRSEQRRFIGRSPRVPHPISACQHFRFQLLKGAPPTLDTTPPRPTQPPLLRPGAFPCLPDSVGFAVRQWKTISQTQKTRWARTKARITNPRQATARTIHVQFSLRRSSATKPSQRPNSRRACAARHSGASQQPRNSQPAFPLGQCS